MSSACGWQSLHKLDTSKIQRFQKQLVLDGGRGKWVPKNKQKLQAEEKNMEASSSEHKNGGPVIPFPPTFDPSTTTVKAKNIPCQFRVCGRSKKLDLDGEHGKWVPKNKQKLQAEEKNMEASSSEHKNRGPVIPFPPTFDLVCGRSKKLVLDSGRGKWVPKNKQKLQAKEKNMEASSSEHKNGGPVIPFPPTFDPSTTTVMAKNIPCQFR
ncbi:hypothetical protein ACE6H2_012985 [Prunus campanulata]